MLGDQKAEAPELKGMQHFDRNSVHMAISICQSSICICRMELYLFLSFLGNIHFIKHL